MTDNELLLAISEIMDKKIKPLKEDIQQLREDQTRINIIIENDIKRDIKMLSEKLQKIS